MAEIKLKKKRKLENCDKFDLALFFFFFLFLSFIASSCPQALAPDSALIFMVEQAFR